MESWRGRGLVEAGGEVERWRTGGEEEERWRGGGQVEAGGEVER